MKQGWELKTLGEVCDVVSGGTPRSNVLSYWDGEVQWLTPKDMGKLKTRNVSDTLRTITIEGLNNSSAKLIPAKSVILSTRAPIGHLAINNNEMAFNQGCRGLIPSGRIDSLFLYYFLLFSKPLLESLGTGTTFKELSASNLKSVKIPLPPLEEQKRIVAVLDEAFAGLETARTNAEANLKNAEELLKSYSKQLFAECASRYGKNTLGDICRVERGSSPRPIKSYVTTSANGVNWVKIGDVQEGQKYISTTKELITHEGSKKSRKVFPGDLILSNSMSFGRPSIMAIEGYIHDGWFVLRLGADINADFLYHSFCSPFIKEQFNSLAAGAVVKNISSDLVKLVLLPVPPVSTQEEIASQLDDLGKAVFEMQTQFIGKQQELSNLRQSLLQKAFAGELT